MKANKYNIVLGVSAIIFALSLLTLCNRSKTVETTKVDTVYVIKKVIDTLEVPTPYAVIKPSKNTIDSIKIKVVDSAYCRQIVEEFYSKNIYKRLIINDSNLVVNLIDTLTQNKLGKSIVDYKITERYITKTITRIEQPKPLSFEIQAQTSFDNLNVLGSVYWHQTGVSGGYDFIRKKPTIGFGLKF